MTENDSSKSPTATVCPTCGSRVKPDATRCDVCGTEFEPDSEGDGLRGTRAISLPLPLALIGLAFFILLSSGLTFAATRVFGQETGETLPTGTITPTPTTTITATLTVTSSPEATFTPLPPIEYRVVENDTCGGIAFAFDVSVRDIIEFNNLGSQCLLSVGTSLLIPQPTATPSPQPSATLEPDQATIQACPTDSYTVAADDTLSGIAGAYNVAVQAIKDWNGLTSDTVFEGQTLEIPLCQRLSDLKTATPTIPPPYPAPNLLLPRDGESFSLAEDSVSLQWASVGELREDEFYQVSVEDVTESSTGSGRRLIVNYVKDTHFVVPASLRPSGSNVHVFRWWVEPVRLSTDSTGGEPRYLPAGAGSERYTFSWTGGAIQSTPTP
jgi:LysM repeat protein